MEVMEEPNQTPPIMLRLISWDINPFAEIRRGYKEGLAAFLI